MYGTIICVWHMKGSVKVQLNSFSYSEPHILSNFANWEPSYESSKQSHHCANQIKFEF